jgi:hypothetical protein
MTSLASARLSRPVRAAALAGGARPWGRASPSTRNGSARSAVHAHHGPSITQNSGPAGNPSLARCGTAKDRLAIRTGANAPGQLAPRRESERLWLHGSDARCGRWLSHKPMWRATTVGISNGRPASGDRTTTEWDEAAALAVAVGDFHTGEPLRDSLEAEAIVGQCARPSPCGLLRGMKARRAPPPIATSSDDPVLLMGAKPRALARHAVPRACIAGESVDRPWEVQRFLYGPELVMAIG